MKGKMSLLLPAQAAEDEANPSRKASAAGASRRLLKRLVDKDRRRSHGCYQQVRDEVRDVYSGPQGALLAAASVISLHTPLGERLFRARKFDLAGMRHVLDVGSGAGQIVKHLIKYGDPGLQITCIDLAHKMLRRGKRRLKSDRPNWFTADVCHLPFADATFDGVTCGYVIEHLPDVRVGLRELSRVLVPGGRMLLLVTEDSFSGNWTSRIWACRPHNRRDFRRFCQEVGLEWHKELWFTKMHEVFRAGGICVELRKPLE